MVHEFNLNAFSKAIKKERVNQKKTVRSMAADFWGLGHTTVFKLENGSTPDLYTLLHVCDCLKVPITTFIKTKK